MALQRYTEAGATTALADYFLFCLPVPIGTARFVSIFPCPPELRLWSECRVLLRRLIRFEPQIIFFLLTTCVSREALALILFGAGYESEARSKSGVVYLAWELGCLETLTLHEVTAA